MGNKEANRFSDPVSLGLDPKKLNELILRVDKEVQIGLLPSAQIAIARHGKLALLKSFGQADNGSLYTVFSVTKAVISSAIWLMMQDGSLDESTKVIDVLPEFGENGKEEVLVEHLLTHTAGFPAAPFFPLDWLDSKRRIERFKSWYLDWEPGKSYMYHPSSAMWVLAEIIERVSGIQFQKYVRDQICSPLGLSDIFVGLPESELNRVLSVVHVGEDMTKDEYLALGLPLPRITEVTEEAVSLFNTQDFQFLGVPGGGGIMGAGDLALFYQALLHGGLDGAHLWSPSILERARVVRTGDLLDPDTGKLASRGLGIVIAGDRYRNFRGFGKTNSPEAFGHNGVGGQIAWADPETGISFVYCTNGLDRNWLRRGRRGTAISSLAASCLA
tara:strand:- start:218 stop:1378 length:1161 start_codon:yes stop_codon:yes gene_type:complete